MTKSIHDFQDEHGRIVFWPSDRRLAHQQAILHHLRGLFDTEKAYSEEEILTVLNEHSTLAERLLTELLDADYLGTDGALYWRNDGRGIRTRGEG